MSDPKAPETLADTDLDAAQGGTHETREYISLKDAADPRTTGLGGQDQFPRLGGNEQLPN